MARIRIASGRSSASGGPPRSTVIVNVVSTEWSLGFRLVIGSPGLAVPLLLIYPVGGRNCEVAYRSRAGGGIGMLGLICEGSARWVLVGRFLSQVPPFPAWEIRYAGSGTLVSCESAHVSVSGEPGPI